MKAGWTQRKIDDICDFRGGGTPSKANENYWRGEIPWVSPKDMKSDVITDSIDHISANAIEESTTNLIPSGSVLVVVRSGILARTVPVAITGREVAINQDIKALCPDKSVDSWFLFYFLKSRLEEMLALASRGATVHRIMADQIRAMEIPVPPLAEQQRIVGVLDEAFASLATAQAHAAQNLQNARALFESCIQVEFGKDVALGELVDIKTGKLDANAAEEDGEYPFFTCSRETYAINNYAFDCEAVLLAGNNAVGDFNVKHYVGKFNAYQRTYVITINSRKRAISRYLYYQLQKNLAKFKSQSVGTGTKFLKLGMIKDMMIPLPTIPEQSRIVNQLDALAAETQRLAQIYEQKLAALAALKKSLLHQAFSGEL